MSVSVIFLKVSCINSFIKSPANLVLIYLVSITDKDFV